jgi:hypothetical protein
MARSWYAYNGVGDATLAQNYSIAATTPGCISGSTICAIYAPADGPTPTAPLSANMRRYIASGLTTGISQPQLPGTPKPFVYLKTI